MIVSLQCKSVYINYSNVNVCLKQNKNANRQLFLLFFIEKIENDPKTNMMTVKFQLGDFGIVGRRFVILFDLSSWFIIGKWAVSCEQ